MRGAVSSDRMIVEDFRLKTLLWMGGIHIGGGPPAGAKAVEEARVSATMVGPAGRPARAAKRGSA